MATEKRIPSLSTYFPLGRSGLRVSPLCLGTMTFGNEEGWGSSERTAREIFTRYLEAGGNFIDTADMYTGGDSERMIGKFMKETGNRDRIVLATKYTFNQFPEDPNAGGNSRKHLREALEASLQRLQTDYIDLYWMHTWDTMTPVEEVMSTMDDLVREGKIRYVALSDVPGWYVGRAQTMAELRGWAPVVALQLEYSLVERHIEHEFVPAALELGIGILPWSPLGSGLLTGKYQRGGQGEGRLKELADSGNPVFEKLTGHNFDIVDTLLAVARELGKSPAQVALNWVTKRPGVTSTIIGATKMTQLEDNLASLSFDIPEAAQERLDAVSDPGTPHPYIFHKDHLQTMVHGESTVLREPAWYRPRVR